MAFLDRDFIACVKCSQDCFHWHARNAMARPHIAPSFLVSVQDSSLLSIPRQFSASFLGKCLGKIQLEGPVGKVWYAEMKREQHVLSFVDPGWSAFVEDLNLQIGDGLLITYLGRNMFKVRIFDMEGLEKESHRQSIIPITDECTPAAHITTQELLPAKIDNNICVYDDVGSHGDHEKDTISNEYDAENQSLENICPSALKHFDKERQILSRKRVVEDLCDQTGVLNEDSLVIDGICKGPRKVFQANEASNTDSHRPFYEADNMEQSEYKTPHAKCESTMMTTHFDDRKEDFMNTEREVYQNLDCELALIDEVEYESHFSKDLHLPSMLEATRTSLNLKASVSCDKQNRFLQRTTRGRPLAERQNVSEMAQRRLIIKANAFKSPFPIARKSLKPSYDHKMVLPKLFVERFMPKKVASLTLTDPQGESWPCKWLGAMKSSCHFVPCISAGWSQFAHSHQLKTNDILVFELIDKQSLHFKVHIFKPQVLDVLSHPPFLSYLAPTTS
ncbi:hypothetical protein L7F22_037610 [Adiantum nelumboides]|nr:hypothetical protein [Adiantum nelumboides]